MNPITIGRFSSDLELVVTFFGGNYNSKTLYRAQREFIPQFILPAVDAD